MGLSVVHGIIRRHEGTIEVQSKEGEGTTFIIRLPLKVDKGAKPERIAPRDIPDALRVLVVDDEPWVLEVVTGYLTGDGHTVETAADGREGLEKFRAGEFDLVMTDMSMPVMSGPQLAAAVKEISPDKPVILLTGFGEMAERLEGKSISVDYTLSKPATIDGLREAISKVTSGSP